jgi:hypothetical protein
MPLHLEEFQGEEFQGYIENVPAERKYLLEQFMQEKNVYELNFAYNVINIKYARTASITGFNADAPLRDKDGLAKHFGEVAKVQHGFRIDEEELLRFNQPRNDDEKQQAIEYVYDQSDDLVQGVQDVKEWMRAQAVYNGTLVYSENNVDINIDFNIPTANKLTITTAWTDHTNAKPIQDIQNAVAQYKSQNNGKKPVIMHLSAAVEADLLQNEQIKAQIYGSPTDSRITTQEQLKNLFNALSLPGYVVQDEEVDNGAGPERLLPERRIAFLGQELGKTFVGPTVEKNYRPGVYVLPIIEEKPPSQEVYVGETVFPALQQPKSVVHMDV